MPLLPKPYPDEVIGSVIERACLQTGMSMKALARSLFGGSRNSFSFLMATDLLQLAPLMGIDSEELLLKHTMYPYAVSYMEPKEQRRLKSKILSRRSDECIGSITRSVSHGVSFRRICLLCTDEELNTFGEAYWHRAHLLPGVFYCHLHGVPLYQSHEPLRDNVQLKLATTPTDSATAEINIFVPDEISSVLLRHSLEALNSGIQARADWASFHKAQVAEKGYAVAGGAIAARKMSQDLSTFFGQAYLEDAGCYYPARQLNPWPCLLIRECMPLNFAAPKHLFLQTFCAAAPPSDGQFGYKKPGKVTKNFQADDAKAASQMTTMLKDIEAAGERITVKDLLQKIGVWQSFRHNRSDYPLTNELVQKFRASGQSERQLGLRPYWRQRLRSRYPEANPISPS